MNINYRQTTQKFYFIWHIMYKVLHVKEKIDERSKKKERIKKKK